MMRLVFVALLLAGCAPQQYWDYEPFTKNHPPLEQATAVCIGQAESAGRNISEIRPQTTTECYTRSYGMSCSEQEEPLSALGATLENISNRAAAEQSAYKSCMASNGWRAALKDVVNGTLEQSQNAAYQGCLSAHSNGLVPCQYEDGIKRVPFCDCRVSGGFPTQ